jgi:hypothetical protein
MNLRWRESPDDIARIAALSADPTPTAIIGCPHTIDNALLMSDLLGVKTNSRGTNMNLSLADFLQARQTFGQSLPERWAGK